MQPYQEVIIYNSRNFLCFLNRLKTVHVKEIYNSRNFLCFLNMTLQTNDYGYLQ